MAVIAVVETLVPLHAQNHWNRAHRIPNLALTFTTFATNLVFNAALVALLVWQETKGVGLVHWLGLSTPATMVVVVLGLDFAFYVAHVAMHTSPTLWRYHGVHHSDPAVDVTTTVRQHPGEGVIRYAFMATFGAVLGATPGAFAVYRAWSAVNALFEHANVRMPRRLDSLLSLLLVTPNMHKVHHSRFLRETNTNYSNISSLFDRMFGTFTPSERGVDVVYGLAGFDDPATQSTAGLLALPFRQKDSRELANAGRIAGRP
jgi:sterol desaturase/sphingolipid hydroxylase (fatty acid hydroxylase superfamily)